MNVISTIHDIFQTVEGVVAEVETPEAAKMELEFLQANAPLVIGRFPLAAPAIAFAENQLQAIVAPPDIKPAS